MANRTRTAPVTQSAAVAGAEADPMQSLENVKDFYNRGNNKNLINGLVIAVVLIVGGFLGYKYLYMAPREKKAADKMFWAQNAFSKDSTEAALKGETGHPGFLKIMKDYSGTRTANLCHYYAGICYLKGGDAKNAIRHLKDFDGHGTLAATAAHGALGNAYAETNNWKEAADHFKMAAKDSKDEAQTPIYLMALGNAAEMAKKPEDAKKAYKRIQDEFPNSGQSREIERHLARLGVID